MKQYNLGIEATLEIIGGKWKSLIICLLMSGRKRTRNYSVVLQAFLKRFLYSNFVNLRRMGS